MALSIEILEYFSNREKKKSRSTWKKIKTILYMNYVVESDQRAIAWTLNTIRRLPVCKENDRFTKINWISRILYEGKSFGVKLNGLLIFMSSSAITSFHFFYFYFTVIFISYCSQKTKHCNQLIWHVCYNICTRVTIIFERLFRLFPHWYL